MSESRVPFTAKRLQKAVAKSFTDEVAGMVKQAQAAYFDTNNIMKFQHGRGWASPANELGDKTGEVELHSVENTLALADVVDGDPSITFKHANEIASGMVTSLEKMMFAKLHEVTEKTGNVVDAAKHGSQLEAMAAMLEGIEMSVDSDGNLNLPTMFVSPGQSAKLAKEIEQAPPEMHERIESIKAKKLEEAIQKEAERKSRFERRDA